MGIIMLEKKTIIDQIEITRNGTLQIRFGKQILEDGKEISCQWHRTSLEPGEDLDAQLAAVNAHLAQMNEAPCNDTSRLTMLQTIVRMVHTPAIVAAFVAKRIV